MMRTAFAGGSTVPPGRNASSDIGRTEIAFPIADGQTAAVRYAAAPIHPGSVEWQRTFGDLRADCARDTLGMVKLREALARLAPSACA